MQTNQERFGDDVYEFVSLSTHIVRARGVCGGRPTFKYTRIEISGALSRLASGESLDSIIAGYQGRVSREAMLEAINQAANIG